MSRHILVIEPDGDSTKYHFECPEGNGCAGWSECIGVPEDRDHKGYDPHEETSPAYDQYEDVEIHGVLHNWQYGYGWTIPFVGCVVDLLAEDLPDELWDREVDDWKVGRWVVDDDWDDSTCYLVLIGPEEGEQHA